MTHLALVPLLLLTFNGCTVPPKVEMPVKTHDARAFFETTTYAMSAKLSYALADDRVLVSSDATGIFNAYSIALDGRSTPLTQSTTDSTFAVSYFPHDDRVLLTADQGGNELNHVSVREANGSVRDLTPGDRVKALFLGWAGDGQTFYVITNERVGTHFDAYAYDARGCARRLIYQNDMGLITDISPDGRWLALVKRNSNADSDVYLIDLNAAAAAPRLVTPHTGAVSNSVFEFTPDSRYLIYSTDGQGEFVQAWTMDLSSFVAAPLVSASWDVVFVNTSRSGRYRVWGINEDARTVVHVLDVPAGRELALRDLPPGDIGSVRFSRDESQIAFTLSSDTSPQDVYVADLPGLTARRLTRALNPAISETDLVTASVVRYGSFDGLEIPSILYIPKQAASARVPALVWVHGGPGGQSRTGYNPLIQHLVNHGYAVLAANNRGSSGYGKRFFHLDDKRHGDVDLKDIVAGKDYLASRTEIDPARIGIIGGSYGGYMVVAALAFQPDAFSVGVDIFGVTNWVRTLKNIPTWWTADRIALYDELGDPATDEERLRAISPLFNAAGIDKPLLVIQGANDPRVLQVESDEIVATVRGNGVPVEYIVFPDEGHGFTKRQNRITASNAFLAFLDAYLKNSAAAAAGS
jgi:dipeptidyl aminopeptidase/acylaminoacyl peptidase